MGNLARKYRAQVEQKNFRQSAVRPKPKKRWTKLEAALFFKFMAIILAFVGFIIANQAKIYSLDRDIYNLERQIAAQNQVNEALELQVIELSTPDRILKIATEQLGMTLDDNNVKVVQN